MLILNEIIDWVENKPDFWQIGIDRLIRNNVLTDTDISELKEICKVECGLAKYAYTPVDFNNLRKYANNSTSSNNIVISKILNTQNICALSNSTMLDFTPAELNVVYGDNGSGKSSFVSILKHTCNTRGNKPQINGNLYNPATYNDEKKAEVVYTIDGSNFSSVFLLNEEISDSVLKSVDVFDAFSANHYIENEDEIAFIPQGLSLIEKFAQYIKRIENELIDELKSPALAEFDFALIEVPEDSTAYTFLNNLTATTTLDELRAESQWDETKNERVRELETEIQKLKSSDPKKELKNNEEKIRRFLILQNKFKTIEDAISGNSLNIIKAILDDFVNTEIALKVSSEKAFSDLPLEGIGNKTWNILWESARKFYDESKKQEIFPETEGICPLCLQDLSPEAKTRFLNFEEFVKNDMQAKYANALEEYEKFLKILRNVSFNFEEQEPTTVELDELIENFKVDQDSYLKTLEKQRDIIIDILTSKNNANSLDDITIENSPKIKIETLIKELESLNQKLKIGSIEDELKPLAKELNQLLGIKKIFDFKPKLAREIFRQMKVNLINSCISKCKTNSITIFSNDLAASYVTNNLKDSFKLELGKLGFNNIKIETQTRGARGKQYHYLRLDEPNANDVSLKDVLSEGEHRCISLATFLSELSLSDHKSSIIFDDPVSSLDHKWRNRIAHRIVEESHNRQVIVFTHDITFLLMLQEHVEKLSCNLNIKSLTRKQKETGLIANNPPWDAMSIKKRIGIINSELQILEKTERDETEEIYNEKAKIFYGKLRETWERLVEEVLLNKVIQRFGREIHTQRLKVLSDLSDSDYDIIEENMAKCSKYFMGHDTSGNLIESIPSVEEVKIDVKSLIDYVAELRKRNRN